MLYEQTAIEFAVCELRLWAKGTPHSPIRYKWRVLYVLLTLIYECIRDNY